MGLSGSHMYPQVTGKTVKVVVPCEVTMNKTPQDQTKVVHELVMKI